MTQSEIEERIRALEDQIGFIPIQLKTCQETNARLRADNECLKQGHQNQATTINSLQDRLDRIRWIVEEK